MAHDDDDDKAPMTLKELNTDNFTFF